MGWNPLAGRLDQLPLVLAGPLLRQVTAKSVTVWVALRKEASVTLKVLDRDTGTQTILAQATRKTVAIGKNLHIVAVTARATSPLTEGKIYFYDMAFSGDLSRSSLLAATTRFDHLGDEQRIAYRPFKLPSFALPPADLNRLRLTHGSCRKANGGTKDRPEYQEPPDAMAMLDLLIEDTADKPFDRPHQLFLTGDQIYADEVADVLLVQLTDAGDTLLGWKEELPGGRNASNVAFGPYEAAKLPPSTRTEAIKNAQFTTQDTRSHLMSLGEYLAMYLFVWSDELWFDPSPIPTVAELKAKFPQMTMSAAVQNSAEEQYKSVVRFRAAIPQVRRALANIPSYMMCDDHEVTDDWNMTRRFCEGVYGSALGTRIIQNGLIAFAICQSWGNTPEQFWEGTLAAGARLLTSVEAVTQIEAAGTTHIYPSFEAEIRQRVGLHDATKLASRSPYGVYHDLDPMITVEGKSVSSESIMFHFTVEGPSHQVIVTDTRTWRTFPEPGQEMHGVLLDDPAVERQLVKDAPALGDRLLLVVATTNIPPIASVREVAFLSAAANYWAPQVSKKLDVATYNLRKNFLYDKDINDSWEFPEASLDRLFVAVTNKFPKIGGVLTGQAVFLSGDVHFSFASRIAYWADVQRLGDPSGAPQKAEAVFGQLVASALKNEKDDTRGLHSNGYDYVPKDWLGHIRWAKTPTGYVGWNLPRNAASRKIGKIKPGAMTPGMDYTVDGKQPTLPVQIHPSNNIVLNVKPDYRYRVDYLATTTTGQTIDPGSNLGEIILSNRKSAAQTYANANRVNRDLIEAGAYLPECVGFNSISEVTFVWQRAGGAPASRPNDPLATIKRVRQTVRWQQVGTEPAPLWASYDVSLNIKDDPPYRRIVADQEPP